MASLGKRIREEFGVPRNNSDIPTRKDDTETAPTRSPKLQKLDVDGHESHPLTRLVTYFLHAKPGLISAWLSEDVAAVCARILEVNKCKNAEEWTASLSYGKHNVRLTQESAKQLFLHDFKREEELQLTIFPNTGMECVIS